MSGYTHHALAGAFLSCRCSLSPPLPFSPSAFHRLYTNRFPCSSSAVRWYGYFTSMYAMNGCGS